MYEEIETEAQSLTVRQIAQRVGVVIWDWQVGGEPMGTIGDVLSIAAVANRRALLDGNWDRVYLTLTLKRAYSWRTLKRELSRIIQIPLRIRTTDCESHEIDMVFLASDAMNELGAVVTLGPTTQHDIRLEPHRNV